MKETKEKKKILITEDGMRSVGFDGEEVLAFLINATVEAFKKIEGPVNELETCEKIIDAMVEERDRMRLHMLWHAIMDDDGEDDIDDDDDEDFEDD